MTIMGHSLIDCYPQQRCEVEQGWDKIDLCIYFAEVFKKAAKKYLFSSIELCNNKCISIKQLVSDSA